MCFILTQPSPVSLLGAVVQSKKISYATFQKLKNGYSMAQKVGSPQVWAYRSFDLDVEISNYDTANKQTKLAD